jgi:hypothetical protein
MKLGPTNPSLPHATGSHLRFWNMAFYEDARHRVGRRRDMSCPHNCDTLEIDRCPLNRRVNLGGFVRNSG